MKKNLTLITLLLLVACIWPIQSNASIILNTANREIDAGISKTYTPAFCFFGCSGPITVSDDPAAITNNTSGSWNQSSNAQVTVSSLFSTTYVASASQDSSIDAAADSLSVTASGSVRADDGGNAYSYLDIMFSIDSGQYSYAFDVTRTVFMSLGMTLPVSDGYFVSGDFNSNTTGLIGPGTYEMGISFYDSNAVISPGYSFPPTSYDYTPYILSFVVAPYTPPSTSVPEPATLLLFGSGLIGLAAFRKKF